MSFLRLLKNSLGFDYRSMALYRMLIGLMVIADVVYRIPDLRNFYTDVGVLPRSIFVSELSMPWSFSLHLASGSLLFIIVLFALHLILGLMLVLGYKTRWAMIGAYIMTVSVHNRNWLINNGGHDVLRAILFLSIFLPLNKWFSMDSALQRDRERPEDNTHMSFWVFAFTFQVFAIYFVSYILKNHPMWRTDFTAIYYASRLDIFATPIGVWTRNFPTFQKLSTIYTAFLEWVGPLLLIFAWVFGRAWWKVRLLTVFLFWGLHLGIILTMYIGLFPYICLAMWAIFIPGPVWEKLFARFRRRGFGKLSIYFDGDCRFCEKSVLLIREFFLLPEVKILNAQNTPAINQLMTIKNSWVVVNEQGEKFFHYEAFLEIMRHSPLGHYLVGLFSWTPVRKIGEVVYGWISHHRPLVGKMTQYLNFTTPKQEVRTFKWIKEGLGALILVTLIAWNLTTIKRLNYKAPFFETITRWLHLYQEWNMFSPYPKMDNVWIEVTGELTDGSTIEVLTGDRDPYSIKDQKFYQSVRNEHWRKFYLNLYNNTNYARYFGGYLCRRWNDRHLKWVPGTKLRKMEIASYSQMNFLNDEKGGIEKSLSWKHWCFDEDFKRESGQSMPQK